MSKLAGISIAQLLFDRQESFNDIVSCLVARSLDGVDLQERITTNQKIILKITKECKSRGFDPAKYQEIKNES